jgi:hypothetical protein
MPGFWFYGKVISPEYIILGLIAISLYLLVKDNLLIGHYYYLSVIIFALAASIKMIVVPFGIIYPLYLILKREKKTLIHFATTPLIISALFFLFNITIITQDGRKVFDKWMSFNSNNTSIPSWENFKGFYLFSNLTWDQIVNGGLKTDYINVILITLFIIIVFISIFRRNRNVLLIPFGVSAIFYTIFIMSTQLYHSWYLMVPLFTFVYFVFLTDHKDKLIQSIFIIAILSTFIINIPRITYKYKFRMQVNQECERNYNNSLLVQDYLMQHYKGGTIIANPQLALPVYDIENVKIIRTGSVVIGLEIGDNSLIKEYPDTEWLYLKNNVNYEDFILIKEFSNGKLYKKINNQ